MATYIQDDTGTISLLTTSAISGKSILESEIVPPPLDQHYKGKQISLLSLHTPKLITICILAYFSLLIIPEYQNAQIIILGQALVFQAHSIKFEKARCSFSGIFFST